MTKTQHAPTRRTNWRRWLLRVLAAVIVLPVVAFFVISVMIGSGVRAARDKALRDHPGDQVAALIAYVDTPTHSFRERGRAVWALGQLGDPRALPVLEKYFTGGPCEHERALCQHELAKAIPLCRGEWNPSALVWRHGSLRP